MGVKKNIRPQTGGRTVQVFVSKLKSVSKLRSQHQRGLGAQKMVYMPVLHGDVYLTVYTEYLGHKVTVSTNLLSQYHQKLDQKSIVQL